jgi:hypothetical protein
MLMRRGMVIMMKRDEDFDNDVNDDGDSDGE